MNGIIKKTDEKQLVQNILSVETGEPAASFSPPPVGKRRLQNLRNKLLALLDGASDHPSIERKMPACEGFFKSVKASEFVALLESAKDWNFDVVSDDRIIHIALWYHCCTTMNKAVKECALFSTERMILLYPLWRFYADESDTYL